MFRRDTLYWHKDLPGRYGIKGRNAQRLKRYVESKPSAKVYLRKMPPDLAKELLAKTDEENLQSAWYDMPFEKHKQFCKPCPIRPLEEDNCYLRFSNYPGMTGVRQGFMLTILYAEGIDQERLKQALFSFPHVDRQKGELPRDKLAELYEMCMDTPVTKGPEDFFNKVVDVLEHLKPEGLESNAEKVEMVGIPFIDQFISKYIYREQPYTPEEGRTLLPYLETLGEVADWAIWDGNEAGIRHRLLNFRQRMDTLVTALRIGDKYGLETYMSY